MIMNLRIRFIDDNSSTELFKLSPPSEKRGGKMVGRVLNAENNLIGYYDLFE